MSMVRSLLPRSSLYGLTYEKLTGILADIQLDFQSFVDDVANSYETDKLALDDVMKMIESFSLLEVYNALPPYFRGSKFNDAGEAYPSLIPGGRLGFARKFIRLMLKNRKDLGVVEMFDSIMGLLGVPLDQYVVLQNFVFHDPVSGKNPIYERVLFASPTINFKSRMLAKYGGDATKIDIGMDATLKGITFGSRITTLGFLFEGNNVANARVLNILNGTTTNSVLVVAAAFIAEASESILLTGYNLLGVYSPAPVASEILKNASMPEENIYYTPTQTITVDVLNNILAALGADFISALKTIAGFMKPTQVVFKDITPAVYLTTSGLYDINMGVRGSYTNPNRFRTHLGLALCSAVTIVNRITSGSVDFVAAGIKPGMIVTITNFVNNTIKNTRIVSMTQNYLELNIADVFLVNEFNVVVDITFDYDHSWQDGRLPYTEDEFSFEDIGRPKPLFQSTISVQHPVIHQPGLVPTQASLGSYGLQRAASHRLEHLDTTHYNTLNNRAGGTIVMGFCRTGAFSVVGGKFHRVTGSFLDDGFMLNSLISASDFTNEINNVEEVRVIAITATDITVEGVTLIDEIPGGMTTICLDSPGEEGGVGGYLVTDGLGDELLVTDGYGS